jgi:hypothetical protein
VPSGTRKRQAIIATLVLLLLALPVGLVLHSLSRFGRDWAAHSSHGTPGTYTVTGSDCGDGQGKPKCIAFGNFGPGDGSKPDRFNVTLGPGVTAHTVGAQVKAIDVGAPGQVYPRDGGDAWIQTSLELSVGALGRVLWIVFAVILPLRDRL